MARCPIVSADGSRVDSESNKMPEWGFTRNFIDGRMRRCHERIDGGMPRSPAMGQSPTRYLGDFELVREIGRGIWQFSWNQCEMFLAQMDKDDQWPRWIEK